MRLEAADRGYAGRSIRSRLRTTAGQVAVYAAAALVSALSAHAQVGAQDGAGEAAVPQAPQDGGPRRWSVAAESGLKLHAKPASEAPVVQTVRNGAVLFNMGCTRGEMRVWCRVKPIRGGARGYADADRLRPARGPGGTVPMGRDDSARRARRRDFDATGRIPCAQERGEALGECRADVARSTGGDAAVVVTFGNGFARTLYFVHGEFTSASATMSGVGTDTDWQVEGGQHIIRVDDQRYDLPHALIFGQ